MASLKKKIIKAITSFNWSNFGLDEVGEIKPEHADYAHALAERIAKVVKPAGVEWHRFDYHDKANTAPKEHYEPVWIVEECYADGGVEIGYFDGFTFCRNGGSDDCHVSWWAPIAYPKPPKVAKEADESAEDGQSSPAGKEINL